MSQLSMYGKLSWRKITTDGSKVLVQGSAHCSRESYIPFAKGPGSLDCLRTLWPELGFARVMKQ